ncbi:MAG TPA: hypothetical protein VK171_06595 [Fimbriimonas sp.]|nr:hypothetical protein [Fimbriimonas sp.]
MSFLVATLLGLQTKPIKTVMPVGSSARYSVIATEVNYEGASNKITKSYTTKTPVVLKVVSPSRVGLILGPVEVAGKSVGRAREREYDVDGSFSRKGVGVTPFAIVLPASGIKPGQSWSGPLASVSPLPAGMKTTYKFEKITAVRGTTCAQIKVSVKSTGSSTVTGTGTVFLKTGNGFLSHGDLKFEISFVRPDPKDAKKFLVNSHQTFIYKILPQ